MDIIHMIESMMKRQIKIVLACGVFVLITVFSVSIVMLTQHENDDINDDIIDKIGEELVCAYIESNICQPFSDDSYTPICSYYLLYHDKDHIYLYVHSSDYKINDDHVLCSNSWQFPVALSLKTENNQVEIVGYTIPEEGSEYGQSLQAIFSRKAIKNLYSLTNADYKHLESLSYQRAVAQLLEVQNITILE